LNDTYIVCDSTPATGKNFIQFKAAGNVDGEIEFNHSSNYLALKYEDVIYLGTKTPGINYFAMNSSGIITLSSYTSTGASYIENIAVNSTGVAQLNPVQVLYLSGTSPGVVSTTFDIDISTYTHITTATIISWSVSLLGDSFGTPIWFKESYLATTNPFYFASNYLPSPTDAIGVRGIGSSLDGGGVPYRCAIWYHT